ncbi:methionine aminopeptidase [Janibacter limosus]|uniref:Methionine aminopeptidase n=1 Tax=Janibacter limosus TaxID=53458 RepID=A0AC61U124_9MICO|nr:methionine aminopeptidase [Janibacter limosus]UUZ43693.1 methionine aminopeptidase [Janibacter limosus]
MAYWYNVDTKQVESDDTRSQNAEVMGPYETEAEAAAAPATARANTEAWDEQDRKDREWESGDAGA